MAADDSLGTKLGAQKDLCSVEDVIRKSSSANSVSEDYCNDSDDSVATSTKISKRARSNTTSIFNNNSSVSGKQSKLGNTFHKAGKAELQDQVNYLLKQLVCIGGIPPSVVGWKQWRQFVKSRAESIMKCNLHGRKLPSKLHVNYIIYRARVEDM